MQLPRQMQLAQRQVRAELALAGSMRGDPLGQFHFHIPLFAGMWSVLRETAIVPNIFTRGYKEVLGAATSRGNICRFCVFWHANAAGGGGVQGVEEAWRTSSLTSLPDCAKRFKALVLFLRDGMHPGYFSENVRTPGATDICLGEAMPVSHNAVHTCALSKQVACSTC